MVNARCYWGLGAVSTSSLIMSDYQRAGSGVKCRGVTTSVI